MHIIGGQIDAVFLIGTEAPIELHMAAVNAFFFIDHREMSVAEIGFAGYDLRIHNGAAELFGNIIEQRGAEFHKDARINVPQLSLQHYLQ